jgi:hypothetical protein
VICWTPSKKKVVWKFVWLFLCVCGFCVRGFCVVFLCGERWRLEELLDVASVCGVFLVCLSLFLLVWFGLCPDSVASVTGQSI